MPQAFLHFKSVQFSFDSSGPLFDNLSLTFPRGWTGIVGANGAGKTTLLMLATGAYDPRRGRVERPDSSLYCPQRTDTTPPDMADLLESSDGEACRLRGVLGLGKDWALRWDSLSHGERKRAQIAAMLWRGPDVLAVDEPTNHIDAEARDLLAEALKGFRGIGLLVSHDRELLDLLCGQCLFLDPPQITMRPGGYTAGRAESLREEQGRRIRCERARSSAAALEKQAVEKRFEAAKTRKRLSKRGIARGDQDSKTRIDMARITGKDAVSGLAVRRLERRFERASTEAESLAMKKKYDLGLWFESETARRDTLFSVPAGGLALGEELRLSFPELVAYPGDRISLTGPNGCGKSTLVRHIVNGLSIPRDRLISLKQEMDAAESSLILENARSLPEWELGRLMSVVNLLGSDPKRLLESRTPSPGEARKLLIAAGISRVPHLIMLDEPTNHLDLPSIECLTIALRECHCGILLVSHDKKFLGQLTQIQWIIGKPKGSQEYKLKVM